jgi:hypothetical protein
MSFPNYEMKISFFSYLAYQPKNSSQSITRDSLISYDVMQAIKGNRSLQGQIAIPGFIKKLVESESKCNFLDGSWIAVPVPGSGIQHNGALWVPKEICNELHRRGLVSEVLECLKRVKPLRKSSYATRGSRSDPIIHFESIEVVKLLPANAKFVIVDDVVTRGSTIAGCAARIVEGQPNSLITAFALIRTMGLGNFARVVDPIHGIIKATANQSKRDP